MFWFVLTKFSLSSTLKKENHEENTYIDLPVDRAPSFWGVYEPGLAYPGSANYRAGRAGLGLDLAEALA